MNRIQLLSILQLVNKAVPTNATMEGLSHFYFSGKEVIGYNSQEFISHPIETEFKCFVKAQHLIKVLSDLKAEEVQISVVKESLRLKTNRANIKLQTIKDKEVLKRIKHIMKSLKDVKWNKLPKDFITNINLCKFVASKSESDGTLTCVHVKGTSVSASDNKRIATATISKKVKEMLIKSASIQNLSSSDPIKYSVTKSWLHFKNEDDCIYSIRNVIGKFPDFSTFTAPKSEPIELPSEISEGIEITSILADESGSIRLTFEDNNCQISVDSEKGKATYDTEMKYKGEKVVININPEFLLQMIKHSTHLYVEDAKRAIIKTGEFTIVTALYGGK